MRCIPNGSKRPRNGVDLLRLGGLASVLLLVRAMVWARQGDADPSSVIAGHSAPAQPVNSTPMRQIVVSLPDRKLAVIEDGRMVKLYSVAIGKKATPSPTGRFKVFSRIKAPTYYHSGQVVLPGQANPLGSRWIGLSKIGYGIHGTNMPDSIGRAASHGCIRMRNSDVEELFTLVRVGDAVEIKADSQMKEWARPQAAQLTMIANSTERPAKDSTQAAVRPSAPMTPPLVSQ